MSGCRVYNEDVAARLIKIEGQIRGIRAMAESGRECEDILMQISAVSSALTGVARLVMEDHIEHCVTEGVKSGNGEEALENLKAVFKQFAKLK